MDKKELTFTIFLIYQLADAWNKTPAEVYQILKSGNIIEGYIVPCYDTLHTLGGQYLVEDITGLIKERGLG